MSLHFWILLCLIHYTSAQSSECYSGTTSTTSSRAAFWVLFLVVILLVSIYSILGRWCRRKWKRDGYIFRKPKQLGRKLEASESSSALTGLVELPSGGAHEMGELMGTERLAEFSGGGHLDKVELMAVERPRELSGANRLDDVSRDISEGERNRRRISVEISAC